MSVAEETADKPPSDPILQKVLEAVPVSVDNRRRCRGLAATVPRPAAPGPSGRAHRGPHHRRTRRPDPRSGCTGRPRPRPLRCRWWCSCTAADGRSATSTPTTGTRAITRSVRALWWCRWITGWRPSTRTPRRSKMLGPQRNGWPRTPRELGADPDRLAVAGDSAGGQSGGGGGAAARDAGGPPIRFQLLWYPATTWDTSLPSFTENADAPLLATRRVNRVFPLVCGPSGSL